MFLKNTKIKNLSKNSIFSIITICYNAENLLEQTIRSIVFQKFDSFEYIVVDGNSSDGTKDIIEKYKEKIDIYISEPDKGIYDAMNKGLRLAKGQFVNFINAGDSFVSDNILSKIASQIDLQTIKIISGDFILKNDRNGNQRIIETKDIAINYLKKDFFACHQAIFIRKDISKEYDLKYRIKADYKWVLEALNQSKEDEVYKINIPIVYYLNGGFSHQNYFKNLKELVNLHYEFFGVRQVILNSPVYLYRFFRSLKDLILK